MSQASLQPTASYLEVRDGRATSVIVHKVPAGGGEAFIEWQRGISQAAEGFAGYRGTDIYPPADPRLTEWVVIVQFTDAASLGRWLESPVRAEWAAKLPSGLESFRLKTLSTGFGTWFSEQIDGSPGKIALWKMGLTVLLGLYPTVMLLSIAVGPYLARMGPAASMLVGNALSVSILQWVLMPPLQRSLGFWLLPDKDREGARGRSIAGLVLVLSLLAAMVVGFRRITG